MNPLVVRWLKIVAWASAIMLCIAGFLFGSFVWLLSGMFDGLCGNTLLAETPSPEGNLRAVVFERNCGATTSFSTQVSVIESGSTLPNEGGNVFVATTGHGKAPSDQGGGPDVQITWLSPTVLRIEYHPLAEVVRAETSFESVRVEYAPPRSNGQ